MPNTDRRTKAQGRSGKHATSGRMAVTYRNTKGQTMDARVLGPGTSSGLKLSLGSDGGRIVDNVAAGTSKTQTNVYFSR